MSTKTVYVMDPAATGVGVGPSEVYADLEDAIVCLVALGGDPGLARIHATAWGCTVPAETMTGKGVWSKAALDAFATPADQDPGPAHPQGRTPLTPAGGQRPPYPPAPADPLQG